MSTNELLTIDPSSLQFPFELNKHLSCSLYLTNKTDNHVAFKVKRTHLKNYRVRPNSGVVLPRSTCEVIVTMQAQKEAPSDMQSNEKFMIQSVIASPGVKEVTPVMFSKEAGRVVEETKLKVTFVCSTTTNTNELLTIDPLSLQFPFELKKQMSCSLYMTNKTDNNVAFKIKTTHPKKYCVRPNSGVVLPRSICEVIVTMQAQKEAPSDTQSNEKFKIQSVIASPGVEEVTDQMFSKEAGRVVEETKLRVTYVCSTSTNITCSSNDQRSLLH
ncbi:Vesicle-associated protein 1-4 [Cardamine amara subsp. amara]|uniref:Vesicle-associated protein 1-4 n=1 Tax=Cardamine amara subsp. amara TaxID=228776 RepID=A0ABD1BQ53_CARAN